MKARVGQNVTKGRESTGDNRSPPGHVGAARGAQAAGRQESRWATLLQLEVPHLR
jgi:hypothetical protein